MASQSVFSGVVGDIFGRAVPLSGFGGRATIIVNSASLCSFAPRNMQLIKNIQDFYGQRHPGKLQLFMFPSVDHAHQERLLPEEVMVWAKNDYGVDCTAVSVRSGINGNDAGDLCPVYLFGRCHVKSMSPNWKAPPIYEQVGLACGPPAWNRTKYLCTADGSCVRRVQHAEVSWPVVKPLIDQII